MREWQPLHDSPGQCRCYSLGPAVVLLLPVVVPPVPLAAAAANHPRVLPLLPAAARAHAGSAGGHRRRWAWQPCHWGASSGQLALSRGQPPQSRRLGALGLLRWHLLRWLLLLPPPHAAPQRPADAEHAEHACPACPPAFAAECCAGGSAWTCSCPEPPAAGLHTVQEMDGRTLGGPRLEGAARAWQHQLLHPVVGGVVTSLLPLFLPRHMAAG